MPHTLDVTLPSDREIRVTRTFDAPRAVVFACHTEPDLVRRWLLGPPGWSMPVCDIDLREGGQYRYVWRSDADGSEFGFRGEFREIVAPERVVHTERPDAAANMGDALCTLTLVERDGRTTLTQTMRFDTPAIRDQALQTGMTDGMGASYDRLERELLQQPVG
ncbi:SRPBCC family protein [Roseisolibacter agri]|uniref:ATPase n=1 Tax=Roseisolibacter agri TaxID=2014610 RepID=A0AA37QBA3_9BACT|nr:SRPBCC family protein [Roseisolibacter agri]GLC25746.1 ATPase [Roseisolibacter agri]